MQHRLFNGQCWTNNLKVGDDVAIPDSDILLFSKIVSISYTPYQGFVYDFDEEHHNYVANNILCFHNTCVSSAVVENFKSEEVGGKPRGPAHWCLLKVKPLKKLTPMILQRCVQKTYTQQNLQVN